jgi:hypothetical protein
MEFGQSLLTRLGKKELSLFSVLVFVGSLFALRYGPRLGFTPAISLLYYFLFFVFQVLVLKGAFLLLKNAKRPNFFVIGGVLVYALVVFVAYKQLDPAALQVDRWSALDRFLEALFQGKYPYQAKSHLDNNISGFPVLFLLAIPFYLLGDVGYLQFAAWFGFAALIAIRFRQYSGLVFLMSLLAGLPAMAYEIFGRSDLFANMVAVAWLIQITFSGNRIRGWWLIGIAVFWGLLLATRGIVVVPLILVSCSILKTYGLKSAFMFSCVVVLSFFLTFLPLYLWDKQLFWAHNPFYVQSGYIPTWALMLVILTSLILGFTDKWGRKIYLHTGVLLFTTILGCCILKSMEIGWDGILWNAGFDITYFILGIPFILLAYGDSVLRNPSGNPSIPQGRQKEF